MAKKVKHIMFELEHLGRLKKLKKLTGLSQNEIARRAVDLIWENQGDLPKREE